MSWRARTLDAGARVPSHRQVKATAAAVRACSEHAQRKQEQEEAGREPGTSAPSAAAAVEEVREELAKRASDEEDDRTKRQGATGWKHW